MSDLLDMARLTDEEVNQAYFTSKGPRSWQGEAVRDAADAQLAKALWAVESWFEGDCECAPVDSVEKYVMEHWLMNLRHNLELAGIARPRSLPLNEGKDEP